MPYQEVSIIGYNANPPPDDGTEVADNEVAWQKHLDKIGDPLKTAVEQIDDNVKAFSDESPSGQPGTRMLFQQTAAPTGWTKETTATFNNTALRIVTGTVTSRTDQSSFTTVFGKSSTDGHALTTAELASHDHGAGTLVAASHSHTLNRRAHVDAGGSNDDARVSSGSTDGGTGTNTAVQNSGTLDVSGSTSNTGSGSAHTHPMDIRVNYHDVVLATKDA